MTTEYLLDPASGQTVQDTTSNAGNLTGVTPLPENDEMVLNAAGDVDAAKTNLYREEIGQAPVTARPQAPRPGSPAELPGHWPVC